MLTCEQALELISAQLDGALTAEEAGALDEHLAQCPACRALRADLSTLHQLLPTLAEEPPAGLKDDIMKAVHASKCTPFHTRKRQWRWRSWASLAAVLVLVLVGGQAVHLWSPPDSSGSVPRANLAGLTGPASGGTAGQTAPAQEDRAGPAGEPTEAAGGSADGANRKDSSAGERPQNRDVTRPADGPEGGQIPASAQEPSVSAPPVSELQPTPSAGPSVMSLMPEDAPQDTQPPSSALTEEGARQALLEWLGQPDAPLTSLGRSEDGTAYRFQTEDGALYSVPLDGSPIAAEPS